MKKEYGNKKAGVKLGTVLGIFTIVCLLIFTAPQPKVEYKKDRSWHVIWEGNFAEAAEADPGAGNSGILNIYFINLTSPPEATFETNASATMEGWCTANGLGYANADDFNVELAHSVNFMVGIKVRANRTHAYRDTMFYHTDVRVRWTSADLGVGADTVMSVAINDNLTLASNDFIWLTFYDDNSGSGYSLSKDETNQITSIKLEAYF
jgi:hypothetical protein